MAETFQIVIDDTSPNLSYFPFSDTLNGIPDLAAGWNPYFTDSGFPSSLGTQGNGSSLHLTSLDGAAFSFNWTGSGVQIFGNRSSSATYDLRLDGQTNASISTFSILDPTLLASYDDLDNEDHTLTLIVRNPSNLSSTLIAIDRVAISVPLGSPNATVSNVITLDTHLSFVGEWSFEQNALTSDDATFHTTSNEGDQAFFNFSGSAVSISGFRDIGSGNYTVQLDDEIYSLNGKSSWKEATQLFFKTGLNPAVSHQLTITNAEDGLLAVGAINVTSVSGIPAMNSSSHGLSGGTIAAIVVACVLGLLVACALLFLFLRRRRAIRYRQSRSPTHPSSVLDIGRGSFQEDEPKDKSPAHASLSFTLELPITNRPPTNSQRAYSEDLVQPIPRSPTVSLKRSQGAHARDSSLGALLSDAPADNLLPEVTSHSPFRPDLNIEPRKTHIVPTVALSPRNSQAGPPPIAPLPPIPTVNVVASSPAHSQPVSDEADNSETIFSFLDISSSGSPSIHQSPAQRSSSLSSSSVSARQNRASHLSQSSSLYAPNRPISYAPDRPISLGFAFDYHRSLPAPLPTIPAAPTPVGSPVGHPTSNVAPGPVFPIRPLPRIPAPAPEEDAVQPPQSAPLLQFDQTPPSLRVETEHIRPRARHRSMSASGASISGLATSSGNGTGNTAGNIFLRNLSHLHPPSANIGISPTDSIPATVSDIHFRHEDSEPDSDDITPSPEGDRLGGSHRPPHPPLPQRTYASPFIVQKLFGDQIAFGRSPGQASTAATGVSSGSSTVLPDIASLRRLPPVTGPSLGRGHERGQSLPTLGPVPYSPGIGREPQSAREQPQARVRSQIQEEEGEEESPQLRFAPGLGRPSGRR